MRSSLRVIGRAGEDRGPRPRALWLSPRDVFANRWLLFAGIAKPQLGADIEAVGWLRRSIEAKRNFPLAHFCLAEALALLDHVSVAVIAMIGSDNSNPAVELWPTPQLAYEASPDSPCVLFENSP